MKYTIILFFLISSISFGEDSNNLKTNNKELGGNILGNYTEENEVNKNKNTLKSDGKHEEYYEN